MKTKVKNSGRAKIQYGIGRGTSKRQLGYFGPGENMYIADAVKGKTHAMDSSESVFFVRELEHIMTYVQQIERAKIKGRLFVPVNTEVPAGATNWTWRQFDRHGIARIIRDYSEDIARVDVSGAEFFNNLIVSLAAGFGYNVQEIRSAGYTGMPLDTQRAETADEAIRRLEDDLIFYGDPRTNLGGFATNANASLISLPDDGAGSSISWATKTADQILRDLNLIANTIVSLTLEVEEPNTMLLPTDAYDFIATKRIGIETDQTVLSYFLKTSPYITDVDKSTKLVGAGEGGANRVICYDRDKRKLEVIIPMDVTQYEPEKDGLEYTVDLESRYGGVAVYKPLSMAYADMPAIY